MSDVYVQALAEMDRLVHEIAVQRDELRRVLAPLLDDPWIVVYENSFATSWTCRCCGVGAGAYKPAPPPEDAHAPDCPALPVARDRILGRSP